MKINQLELYLVVSRGRVKHVHRLGSGWVNDMEGYPQLLLLERDEEENLES
jgi:hypothetical protein